MAKSKKTEKVKVLYCIRCGTNTTHTLYKDNTYKCTVCEATRTK